MTIHLNGNTIKQLTIYEQAKKTESKNGQVAIKVTPTQKTAIEALVKEYGFDATSTFLRQMLDCFLEYFPYRGKMVRHKKVLMDLLNSLP